MSRRRAADEALADRPTDNYPTPTWVTNQFITEVLRKEYPEVSGPFLDPCAGEGHLISVIELFGYRTAAVDIQPGHEESLKSITEGVVIANFLQMDPRDVPFARSVITNPPFTFNQEFIEECVRGPHLFDFVAFLMRLPMLSSVKRYEWWHQDDLAPEHIYVLSARPKFLGGGNDMSDYAWFVWRPNESSSWPCKISILPPGGTR